MPTKPRAPERHLPNAPTDMVAFNTTMNEHLHATQQCLVDIALAVGEVVGAQRLSVALDARINDSAIDRTEKSAAMLSAAAEALRRRAAMDRQYRT